MYRKLEGDKGFGFGHVEIFVQFSIYIGVYLKFSTVESYLCLVEGATKGFRLRFGGMYRGGHGENFEKLI